MWVRGSIINNCSIVLITDLQTDYQLIAWEALLILQCTLRNTETGDTSCSNNDGLLLQLSELASERRLTQFQQRS